MLKRSPKQIWHSLGARSETTHGVELRGAPCHRLLNMTSGIPNYSETEWMSRAWASEPMRAFTLNELADAAYPSNTNQLPVNKGYYYSNTNYVLAAMIAGKAAGKSFSTAMQDDDLFAECPPDNEQWFDQPGQVGEALDQLVDAGPRTSPSRSFRP